ncbi:MAG: DUF2851 family protein [Chitinophagaceae bacterium]
MITERLLQFIWQFQYSNRQDLLTVGGESLQVIFAGEWNSHQGPDFKQARIKLGDTLWAGEVELHLKASDWHRHHHTNDNHYSKVILHAVWEDDEPIADQNGHLLPTVVLQHRVSNLMLRRYQNWMSQLQPIPCLADITSVPALAWQSWKERLMVERLEQKAGHIQRLLQQTQNNWEEVFWRILCRYFGAGVNSECFEQLAASLPVQVLAKHKNQLQQVECLLLGQAGLLNKKFRSHYPLLLQKEYRYLRRKYQLQPITKLPVFLRMRPVNFPTVRLAQLAMLVHQSVHLFSKLKEAGDLPTATLLFSVTANDFWNDHFKLEEASEHQPKKLGVQMINTLLINAVAPTLFAYGKYAGESKYCDKAIEWLEVLPKEENAFTRLYTSAGIENNSALDSQALLHLKKNYCDEKRCLECAVGNALLKKGS